MKRISVILSLLVISVWVSAEETVAPAPAPPNGQQTPASEITTKPELPKRGVFWYKDKNIMVGTEEGKGSVAGMEMYGLDVAKKESGPANGPLHLTIADCPLPLCLSLDSSATGSGSMAYANTILDVHLVTDYQIDQGLLYTTDGNKLCTVQLTWKNAKELFISPDYIVFPDNQRTIGKDGPFATLRFDTSPQGDEEQVSPDDELVVLRNGKIVLRGKIAHQQKFSVDLAMVKRKDDMIEWRVTSQGGVVTYQGIAALPVGGATPGLVQYVVSIPKHPVANVKQDSSQ